MRGWEAQCKDVGDGWWDGGGGLDGLYAMLCAFSFVALGICGGNVFGCVVHDKGSERGVFFGRYSDISIDCVLWDRI